MYRFSDSKIQFRCVFLSKSTNPHLFGYLNGKQSARLKQFPLVRYQKQAAGGQKACYLPTPQCGSRETFEQREISLSLYLAVSLVDP